MKPHTPSETPQFSYFLAFERHDTGIGGMSTSTSATDLNDFFKNLKSTELIFYTPCDRPIKRFNSAVWLESPLYLTHCRDIKDSGNRPEEENASAVSALSKKYLRLTSQELSHPLPREIRSRIGRGEIELILACDISKRMLGDSLWAKILDGKRTLREVRVFDVHKGQCEWRHDGAIALNIARTFSEGWIPVLVYPCGEDWFPKEGFLKKFETHHLTLNTERQWNENAVLVLDEPFDSSHASAPVKIDGVAGDGRILVTRKPGYTLLHLHIFQPKHPPHPSSEGRRARISLHLQGESIRRVLTASNQTPRPFSFYNGYVETLIPDFKNHALLIYEH